MGLGIWQRVTERSLSLIGPQLGLERPELVGGGTGVFAELQVVQPSRSRD